MSNSFKFKQFEIFQEKNPHKVGSDSMLLGAWTAKSLQNQAIQRVLDIGTGTGILALMMAQKFDMAQITAVEAEQHSFEEAMLNFKSSQFSDRILGIKARIQEFDSIEKFELIICNPPYFNGSFLGTNEKRNNARHTQDFLIPELYESADNLLSQAGKMFLVLPYSELKEHLERAFDKDLFMDKIMISTKEDGSKRRAFISVGRDDVNPSTEEMLVKDSKNNYSSSYISLTRDFYLKDLSTL
jgi:tRNA1Val (adenine37-N6)-methyltransferase